MVIASRGTPVADVLARYDATRAGLLAAIARLSTEDLRSRTAGAGPTTASTATFASTSRCSARGAPGERAALGSRGGPPRSSSSWTTWSATCPTMNRSGMAPTVISPNRGCSPTRARSAARPPASATGGPRSWGVSRLLNVRSYSSVAARRREGSIALEDAEPLGVGREPTEGHRSRAAGQDPLDLAQPVGRHLAEMGQDLGRGPVPNAPRQCDRRRPPAATARPLRRRGGWPRVRPSRPRGERAGRRPWRQCGGRSMGRTTGRATAPEDQR